MAHGSLIQKPVGNLDESFHVSFMIIPRYGQNLEEYFEMQNKKFSNITIYELGIRILEIFQYIHAAGFTYNDLKLDNLLIGFNDTLPNDYTSKSCFNNVQINLVDYGFSTRFILSDGS